MKEKYKWNEMSWTIKTIRKLFARVRFMFRKRAKLNSPKLFPPPHLFPSPPFVAYYAMFKLFFQKIKKFKEKC